MAQSPQPRPLTPRQREILRMVAVGFADKQIADLLGVSIYAVRTHLRRLSQRFGAHGRYDLAIRTGAAVAVVTFGTFPTAPDRDSVEAT